MALVVGLLLLRRRVSRGAWRLAATALLIGGVASGCGGSESGDDDDEPPNCGPAECLEGEVERGQLGRYASIAADGDRIVVSAYEDSLGDLVLIDVPPGGGDWHYTAVDGVPDELPSYVPTGYRGGIVQPGPDVGHWTSVALSGGKARIAFQDVERKALRFAAEQEDGKWVAHDVDAGGGAIGLHASLAIGPDGAPAIAYLATQLQGEGDTRKSELRLARASGASPAGTSDWTITTLAEQAAGCAGLCGTGQACVAATAELPEACGFVTDDCSAACADTEACVAGVCRAEVATPLAIDLPQGAGLFANLLAFSDGRLAVVYYDRGQTALVLAVESAAGSSSFQTTIVDGGDDSDRGMWASALIDGGGTVHIAYQESLGDQLMYTTWNGSPGTPELVDDGARAGDTRSHPVGASAALYLDAAGSPAILYQDGLASDLVVSRRSGGAWSRSDLLTGTRLDGFFVGVAAGGGAPWLVSFFRDPTVQPSGGLEIRTVP